MCASERGGVCGAQKHPDNLGASACRIPPRSFQRLIHPQLSVSTARVADELRLMLSLRATHGEAAFL